VCVRMGFYSECVNTGTLPQNDGLQLSVCVCVCARARL